MKILELKNINAKNLIGQDRIETTLEVKDYQTILEVSTKSNRDQQRLSNLYNRKNFLVNLGFFAVIEILNYNIHYSIHI